MLVEPLRRVPGPYPVAISDRLLTDAALADLEASFTDPQPFVRHQDSFYRCDIARVDERVPAALTEALRDAVSSALDVPLAGPVHVTAQRMNPSDGSDRHTDHPRAGYEYARLILQLDAPEGGRFRAFADEAVWLTRPPRRNHALALELSPRSDHDVTPCAALRRSVVFHFFHPQNPPDAAQRLAEALGPLRLADLPRALHPLLDDAEARLPDTLTGRAALGARHAHRRGRPLDAVAAAYRDSCDGRPLHPDDQISGFLVGLHLDGFDHLAWRAAGAPRWVG